MAIYIKSKYTKEKGEEDTLIPNQLEEKEKPFQSYLIFFSRTGAASALQFNPSWKQK